MTPLLMPGTIVDRYQIVRHLASGGMGAVYHATHLMLERPVALKLLHQTGAHGENADRLLCEARAVASIQHPNVVSVLDFGYFDGRPYLAMELLIGKALDELLDGPMLPARAVQLAQQLASALTAIHDAAIIHGDISSTNIHVCVDDVVKLIDFGLARGRDDAAPTDQLEFVVGTPAYVAPEQVRGQAATEHSDQYAFGVVLYEMLTGHHPYEGKDVDELCRRHLDDPTPEIITPHTLCPELVQVVQRCLEKKPGRRYPAMHDVVLALQALRQRP